MYDLSPWSDLFVSPFLNYHAASEHTDIGLAEQPLEVPVLGSPWETNYVDTLSPFGKTFLGLT